MRKVALVLAVLFTFLLVTPTLAQQWQTFYLTPSDPHWVRIYDPERKLTCTVSLWYSNCLAREPRPKIYFKIPELNDKGGYIKFWYGKSRGWNQLLLYASKDDGVYVELWKSSSWEPTDKTEEVTVKVPPGYKYFYFYFEDGNSPSEELVLWKKIQFKVGLSTPTPTPTPTPPFPSPPITPSPPQFPSTPSPQPQLGVEGSGFLIACIAVAVATLIATRLKKV